MKTLFITLSLLIANVLWAQDKKWTMTDCMRYAVENCQKRHQQDAMNKINDYNYQEAIASLLPSLGASTSAYMNFGRGVDAATNTYIDVSSFYNNYEIGSSMVLFSGLSKIARIRVQNMNRLMGKNQLEQVNDDIAYEVMSLYYNLLYYANTTDLAQKQYDASTKLVEQVARMEELGLKGAPDVAEFEAQQAADKLILTRQKNLYAIELIKLKEKMNYPLGQDIQLADSIDKQAVLGSNERAYDIYEQSLQYLPKALVAQQKLKVQERMYQQTKGQLFPTISARAGINTSFSRLMDGSEYMPFSEQFRERRGQYVGVSLDIPIFSGLSRFSDVRRAKQQLKIAENEQSLALRTLYSEIEQAVTDMNGQAEEYQQAQKQLAAKKIAHQQNISKYDQGLISALELNTSANRLLQASVEELKALYQYQLKHKLVNYYKGEAFF